MSSRIGLISEREFELQCLKLNIPIFQPVIDNYGIDYVIKRKHKLIKIQVKSTMTRCKSRNTYKINVVRGFDGRMYDKSTYDILVVYLIDIATYYIIPHSIINSKCIRINPESIKGKYSPYKEAWNLLK